MSLFTCPECGNASTKTLESRFRDKPYTHTRRRRECPACGHRFGTREIYDDIIITDEELEKGKEKE